MIATPISEEFKIALSAEQELDRVYHAIPEWVHREFPNKSLSEKIHFGFEDALKTWTEMYRTEFNRHQQTNGFVLYLLRKQGLDLSSEYWEYLKFKDSQQPTSSVQPSPPTQAV